jgi:hypothetical protein
MILLHVNRRGVLTVRSIFWLDFFRFVWRFARIFDRGSLGFRAIFHPDAADGLVVKWPAITVFTMPMSVEAET